MSCRETSLKNYHRYFKSGGFYMWPLCELFVKVVGNTKFLYRVRTGLFWRHLIGYQHAWWKHPYPAVLHQHVDVVLWGQYDVDKLFCYDVTGHSPVWIMSAAPSDDADSWQRDANIRPTDTVTELGHNRQCFCRYCRCWVCSVQPVLWYIVVKFSCPYNTLCYHYIRIRMLFIRTSYS